MKKNVVKVVALVVFLVAFAIIAVSLAGCSEADRVNYNIFIHRGRSQVTHWMPLPELPEETK